MLPKSNHPQLGTKSELFAHLQIPNHPHKHSEPESPPYEHADWAVYSNGLTRNVDEHDSLPSAAAAAVEVQQPAYTARNHPNYDATDGENEVAPDYSRTNDLSPGLHLTQTHYHQQTSPAYVSNTACTSADDSRHSHVSTLQCS
ncbi:hypothetical protein Hanom_Chr06g00499311 [Helianthus anomalus]